MSGPSDASVRAKRALKLVRIVAEAAAAVLVTAATIDFTASLTPAGRWIGHLQLVPAAMVLGLSVLAFWLAVTLMFGRIYCSTVCPMGALIDLFARFRGVRRPYRFSPARSRLRLLVLILFVVAVAMGLSKPASVVEPYEAYRRICLYLFRPRIVGAFTVAAATLLIAAWTAWRHGRILCNTVCPVGTLLGAVSEFSLMRIDIDTDRCIHCRRCADVCKAKCIDLNDHVVDVSRCVVCFDCLPVCPNDAINYTSRRHRLSIPMMQRLSTSNTLNTPCDNTSNCSATSSTTERQKPTAPAPARSACSDVRCASTSPTDSRC